MSNDNTCIWNRPMFYTHLSVPFGNCNLMKRACFWVFFSVFYCRYTGKSFTRKEHFTNHIMWHTGETPHRCDFCSKTFTRKEHLLNHVRQHTGESPHRCGFCSKSFTRKEHLVNHIRQHTGESGWQMFTSRATDIIVISIKSSCIIVTYLCTYIERERDQYFFSFFSLFFLSFFLELRDSLGTARVASCVTSHLGDAIEHESRHSSLHMLPVSHIWLTYGLFHFYWIHGS